jgi:hypothetical protein
MPVPSHLHRKLQETLGADAAVDFANMIEGMDANRGDVGELRHEMQLGFARIDARFLQVDARFEQLEARFEQMDARFEQRFKQLDTRWVGLFETGQARMESLLEKGLREQTRFFFVAWSVLLAAIVGMYAR